MINNEIASNRFPDNLKIALVKPIYKSGDKYSCDNYRGISVLPQPSKIYERIIYNRLYEFFNKYNIINENQFGFTPFSNTQAATIQLISQVQQSIDKKKSVAVLYIDLKKAFDSMNHTILIGKLQHLGMHSSAIDLVKSYMFNRKQYVKIQNAKSSIQVMKIGVPQGSLLGPLFFVFFINDIFNVKLSGVIQLFADDIAIFYEGDSKESIIRDINEDLQLLSIWFSANCLEINIKKTNYMIFKSSTPTNPGNSNVYYNGVIIKRVETTEYLGLHIDERLTWDLHINQIKKKIRTYMFALRKSRKCISEHTAWSVYYAYIYPHLIYLNTLWSSATKDRLHELQILQNKTFKIILKLPYLHPTVDLYSESKLPLELIAKYELLLLIFKFKSNLLKCNFKFINVKDIHIYNTRIQK